MSWMNIYTAAKVAYPLGLRYLFRKVVDNKLAPLGDEQKSVIKDLADAAMEYSDDR